MSDRIRYQAQSILAERTGVTTYRGVDPVTGLPVLIYRFRGTPDPALARLDSEYLPRLLAWRDDGETGVMVVAWSSALVPAEGNDLDSARLLDAARALADAAAAGLTHGDLTPERFLVAGGSMVLEGFGVPWHNGDGSGSSDVRAWANSVRELGYASHEGALSLLAEVEAGREMSASELLEELRDVLLRSEPVAPAAHSEKPEPAAEDFPELAGEADDGLPADFGPLELTWDDPVEADTPRPEHAGSASQLPDVEQIQLDYDPEAAVAAAAESEPEPDVFLTGDSGEAAFVPSDTYASERLSTARSERRAEAEPDETPEPEAALKEQQSADRLPAGGSPSFVRRSESAVRPAAQPAAERPRAAPVTETGRYSPQPAAGGNDRSSHRPVMIVALLVLSAVLIVLVLLLRRGEMDQVAPQPLQSVTYVIDVLVEPGNLPPVNLYVLQSPPSSQFTDGTILGTAPRRIALDAEGTWVFEGRFQGRVSDSVTISIPEDRSSAVTITIPPAEGATEDE